MPALQAITDTVIAEAIAQAKHRVVLIAPGIWPPVARALADAWGRLGPQGVTVILDLDPEVCRIGYGSLDAVALLRETAAQVGEAIGQESGVRICVVIADGRTYVFSPTPRQLEAPLDAPPNFGAESLPPRTNGLVLVAPPPALERDLGSGLEGSEQRSLGLDSLDATRFESMQRSLAENPPKNFDLARAVSVYNSHLRFVELTVTGCRLSERKVTLPRDLIHVVRSNAALARKIENSMKLLDADDNLVNDPQLSQETISRNRQAIEDDFFCIVPKVGSVIERRRQQELVDRVEALRGEVTRFQGRVETKLQQKYRKLAEELAAELLPDVLSQPPQGWGRKLGPNPNPDQVLWRIVDKLLDAFGDPAAQVRRMSVETVFKDVTYDMLRDPVFQEKVSHRFPELAPLVEFTAAAERRTPPLA